MTKVWIITDTHFHHYKLSELCGRPVDFTDRIIRNWQRMVGDQDLVFHLGDVSMAKKERTKEILASLPGRKILILGNHDHESPTWYMGNGFALACQSIVFRNALLSHAPANDLPANATVNVHGHHHNNQHRALEMGEFTLQSWHRLLAIENTRYEPVLWDRFVGNEPLIQL